jgi:RNA polymerase sigma-70 factor (ECF subfamily)
LPEGAGDTNLRSGDAPVDRGVAALTGAIARGDQAALATFYETWFDRCFHLARSLTRRDESFCLDTVQDAMLRVARSMKQIDSAPELERWMARVVHTAALDLLRKESRRVARERRRSADATHLGEQQVSIDERVHWLRDQLASLGAEDRNMLALRFVQDRTLEETGKAVGMTGDAAHGKLRRVLEQLRAAGVKELDDE